MNASSATLSSLTAPTVSVLLASYNYEAFVVEAVKSVLGQTFTNFELVVVDDGSTDNSLPLLRQIAAEDARVRVFTHANGGNHGLPATLQLGLAEARGEFVAFLESDDLWRADCLELRMAALAETPEADVVFNGVEPLPMPDADTGWFNSYVPRIMAEHAKRGRTAFRLDTALLLENKIPTFSCAMVRRTLLESCEFTAPVPRWLDWWLWMQMARTARFRFVPEPLTLWRLHAASYNHKIEFSRYIADSNALWQSFRRCFLPHFQQNAPMAALLLHLPHHARLLARLAMIATQSSPLETIRRIRGRLK